MTEATDDKVIDDLMSQINQHTKMLENLTKVVDIDNRALGNKGKFHNFLDQSPLIHTCAMIDWSKTSAVSPIDKGATAIKVNSVEGFKVGQEVTLYDDTNLERTIIVDIMDVDGLYVLKVLPIQNSYVAGAAIARSTIRACEETRRICFDGWTDPESGVVTPLLEEDIRYCIIPQSALLEEVVAWVQYEADPNFSVDGYLSIHNQEMPESYTPMSKTTDLIVEGLSESTYLGHIDEPKMRATLKFTMTRNDITMDKGIKQILGAIS